MLITEVSVDQMYSEYTQLRRILFIAVVLAMSLMTQLLFLWGSVALQP
jgi:hypothetical protein